MADALIIDDNRETADALQQMLEVLGIPARVAYGASPAISALSSFTPRLVLLDINMPGVDGTEILAFLRRSNALCRAAQSLSSSSLPILICWRRRSKKRASRSSTNCWHAEGIKMGNNVA
jgi:CheY-like chemotaxis protein